MPARPRFVTSHLEPRTVPLSDGLRARLADPGLDPEAALIEREEAGQVREPRHTRLRLDVLASDPQAALAVDWWLLGLTQREVGAWMGVSQPACWKRIRRGVARLRTAGR